MKRLVLVGAGHSHTRVLKEFALHRPSGVQVTLISPDALAPYSGMIPGWLAGYYGWQECCIDFDRLCRRADAAFLKDEVVALDPDKQELVTAGGARMHFDLLSLDVGATVNAPVDEGVAVIPMRPLSRLKDLWDGLQQRVRELAAGTEFRIVVVGGGAAGVESMLAIRRQLTRIAPQVRFRFALAVATPDILPGMASGAARRMRRHLGQHGIDVLNGFTAGAVEHGRVLSTDGCALKADAVLWATNAEACAWLRNAGFGTDENGFVSVDASLRSLSHPNVFAAGDCAAFDPPLPKAGVYAVRMGPVLAHNLFNALTGRPLRRYLPQKRYLSLIGTSDDSAVAAWGPLSWQGRWVWRWKQRIDRRFLTQFNLDDGD